MSPSVPPSDLITARAGQSITLFSLGCYVPNWFAYYTPKTNICTERLPAAKTGVDRPRLLANPFWHESLLKDSKLHNVQKTRA